MIAYKIVRYGVGETSPYHSAFVPPYLRACVTYRPGRRSLRLRGCGPLAAFKDLEALANFLWSEYGGYMPNTMAIFYAEVDPSEDNTLWKPFDIPNVGVNETDYLPSGTLLCDSIMLLEDVTDQFCRECRFVPPGAYVGGYLP